MCGISAACLTIFRNPALLVRRRNVNLGDSPRKCLKLFIPRFQASSDTNDVMGRLLTHLIRVHGAVCLMPYLSVSARSGKPRDPPDFCRGIRNELRILLRKLSYWYDHNFSLLYR